MHVLFHSAEVVLAKADNQNQLFLLCCFVKTWQATNMRSRICEKSLGEKRSPFQCRKRSCSDKENLQLGPQVCIWLEWDEELASHISSFSQQADTQKLFKSATHSATELLNTDQIRKTLACSSRDMQREILTGSVSIARKCEAKARNAKVLNSVPLMTL